MTDQTSIDLPQFLEPAKFLFGGDNRPSFWIAGGSLLSLLTGAPVNDYDVFSADPEKTAKWFKAEGYEPGFENDLIANFQHRDAKVQVIKRHTRPSMEATIDLFDFTAVCAAFDGERFVCHPRFYLDAAQRRLVVHKLTFPLSSVRRALKYSRKGFFMCPVGLAAMLRMINEMPIDWADPEQNQIEFYPDGTPSFRGVD